MDDTSETGRPKVRKQFLEARILLGSFGHGLSNLRDTRVTRIGVPVLLFGLIVNNFVVRIGRGSTWDKQSLM